MEELILIIMDKVIKGVSGVPRIGEKGAIKVLTGLITLTENQKKIFESCKDIIDIRRNPNLPKIEEFITEWMEWNEGYPYTERKLQIETQQGSHRLL